MVDGKELEGERVHQSLGRQRNRELRLGSVLANPGAGGEEVGQECKLSGKRKVGGSFSLTLEWAEKQEWELLTNAGAGRGTLNDGPFARIVEHRSLCQ